MALRAVSRSRVNQRSSGAGRGRPHIPNAIITARSTPMPEGPARCQKGQARVGTG